MTETDALTELPWLPHLLRTLAERFGLGVALSLSAEFGGRRISVPKRASANHPIAKAVGLDAMKALCAMYGGSMVDIPLGPTGQQARRAREIARLNDQGRSASDIARLTNCHERTVFNHRRKRRETVRSDPRQKSLF